jgi:hypothetical protein
MAPPDVLSARNAALAYIQAYYFSGPGSGFSWNEDRVVDEGLVDWMEYQYTALSWIVTVGTPTVAPEVRHYDITVTDPTAGFRWEGRVETDGHVIEGSEQVLAAFDTAIRYLDERYAQLRLADMAWNGHRVTPLGLVGYETYEYGTDEWTVTVSYPVVAPDVVVYTVAIENETTGFVWEGDMDPMRQLTQTAAFSRAPDEAA